MGSCYSFLLSIISASGPQQRQQQRDSVLSCPHSESEMASRRGDGRGHSAVAGSTNGDGSGGGGALLAVDRTMSAPTIHFDGTYISGHGLALASVSIEQDAAYWEYHINNDRHDEDEDDNDNEDTSKIDYEEIRFGVCTAKNQSFYKALNADDGDDGGTMHDAATSLMESIPGLSNGDVVGVAVQQSDLPMIQFFCNGEPIHDIAINRFRGMVYPSIYLCGQGDDDDYDNGASMAGSVIVTPIFQESGFKHAPPHPRFGPLIAARSIV